MNNNKAYIDFIGRDGVSGPLSNATKSMRNLNKSASALHRPLGKISTASNDITKSLEASNARVIAFGASALVINGVKNAFVGTLRAAKDLELSLTKIQSINKATSSQMRELSNTITQVSRDTGQTFSVAAEAATEFARQGLSAGETAKRLKAAMIQVRIEGVSATEAVSGLTAIINGFSSSGLDAIQILNKLNAVADSFAVSSKDITEGFKRGGAVAEQAKVSFDEYSAAIAVVQQKTARGGAVIGNAFKTIFTRIQNKSTITALQGIGVEVENVDGSLRNAIDVLRDVAVQTDKLSELKRQNIFEKIAGKRQIALLIPLIQELNSEYGNFDRAVSISQGSTNEAILKNEAYNNTLDGTLKKINSLGVELSQVSGTTLLSELTNGVFGLDNLSSGLEGIIEALNSSDFSPLRAALKGLGSFLSGPGFAIGLAAIGSAFFRLAKFSAEGALSMIGLKSSSQKIKMINESMTGILSKNHSTQKSSTVNSMKKAEIEANILRLYQQQAMALKGVGASSIVASSAAASTKSSPKTGAISSGNLLGGSRMVIPNSQNFGGEKGLKKRLKLNNQNLDRLRNVSGAAASGLVNRGVIAAEIDFLSKQVKRSRGSMSVFNEVVAGITKTSKGLNIHMLKDGADRLRMGKETFLKFNSSLNKLSKTGTLSRKEMESFRSKVHQAGGDLKAFGAAINKAKASFRNSARGRTQEFLSIRGGVKNVKNRASGLKSRAAKAFSGRAGGIGLAAGLALPILASGAAEYYASNKPRAERTRKSRFNENAIRDVGTFAGNGALLGASLGPKGAIVGGIIGAGLGIASALKKASLSIGEITSMMQDSLNKEIQITRSLSEALANIDEAAKISPNDWKTQAFKSIQSQQGLDTKTRDDLKKAVLNAPDKKSFDSDSQKILKERDQKSADNTNLALLITKISKGQLKGQFADSVSRDTAAKEFREAMDSLDAKGLMALQESFARTVKILDEINFSKDLNGDGELSDNEKIEGLTKGGLDQGLAKSLVEASNVDGFFNGGESIGNARELLNLLGGSDINRQLSERSKDGAKLQIERFRGLRDSPFLTDEQKGVQGGDFQHKIDRLVESLDKVGNKATRERNDLVEQFSNLESDKDLKTIHDSKGLSVAFNKQLSDALIDGIGQIDKKRIADEFANLTQGLSSSITNSHTDVQDMLLSSLGRGANVEGRFATRDADLRRKQESRQTSLDTSSVKEFLEIIQKSKRNGSLSVSEGNKVEKNLSFLYDENLKNIKSAGDVQSAIDIIAASSQVFTGDLKDSLEKLDRSTTQKQSNISTLNRAEVTQESIAKKRAEFESLKSSQILDSRLSSGNSSRNASLKSIGVSERLSEFSISQRARLDNPAEFKGLSIEARASKETAIKRSIIAEETKAAISKAKIDLKLNKQKIKSERDNISALQSLEKEVRRLVDFYHGRKTPNSELDDRRTIGSGNPNSPALSSKKPSPAETPFNFFAPTSYNPSPLALPTADPNSGIKSSGSLFPPKQDSGFVDSRKLSIEEKLLDNDFDVAKERILSEERVKNLTLNFEDAKKKRKVADLVNSRDNAALTDLEVANKDPFSTRSQKAQAFNKNRQLQAKDPYGNFQDGLRESFASIQDETASFQNSFAKDIPLLFRDNMAQAFASVAKDFSSLEDAGIGFIQNIADAMTQKFSGQLANQIIGSGTFGGSDGTGGIFGAISSIFTRRKNSGGLISGGTGTKDDVPVMTRGGEYVMKKSAVQKYGVGFFDQMNNGTGFASGGLVGAFDAIGGLSIGAGLSSIAGSLQNRKNNKANEKQRKALLANAGSQQSGSDFFIPGVTTPDGKRQGYLGGSGLSSFLNQKVTSGSRDQFSSRDNGFSFSLEDQSQRLSLRSLFGGVDGATNISSEIATAKGEASGLLLEDARIRADLKQAQKDKKKGLFTSLLSAGITGGLTSLFGGFGGASAIQKKASGGKIAAMGGEYMLSGDTVNQYGTQFLDSLNTGAVPTKFASGGSTSSASPVSSVSSSNDDIKDLASEIRKNGLGKTEININIDSSGGSTTSSGSTNEESIEEQKNLARLIEGKVVEILEKQKRVGNK